MNDKYIACYEDLTIAAHRAYTRGVQTGSGGNLSVRIPGEEGMIVKSSGGSFADCDTKGNGWVAMNFDGTLKKGEKGKPTREWRLHSVLLEHLEGCNAVVHTHSPYAIAWADKHKDIPLVTWHSELKIGCALPVFDVHAAVVPKKDIEIILKTLQENTNLPAIILRGHGLVVTGKNAVAAEHMAELVEETAQIAVLENMLR